MSEDERKFYDETPNLPTVRLVWRDVLSTRRVGLVNGHGVYTVQRSWAGDGFKIFHRLPVKQIDKTFKTSDEAKLFADTHLHRAMRALGFVAR